MSQPGGRHVPTARLKQRGRLQNAVRPADDLDKHCGSLHDHLVTVSHARTEPALSVLNLETRFLRAPA